MSNIEKAVLIANNKELTNKVTALEAKLYQMSAYVVMLKAAHAVALEAASTTREFKVSRASTPLVQVAVNPPL